MALELLPEIAYTVNGDVRVTLHRTQPPFPPMTWHHYMPQPHGAWSEAEILAAVSAQYGEPVTLRLPEATPTPNADP